MPCSLKRGVIRFERKKVNFDLALSSNSGAEIKLGQEGNGRRGDESEIDIKKQKEIESYDSRNTNSMGLDIENP